MRARARLLLWIAMLALPTSGAAQELDSYSFTNAAGTRTYKVYEPASYDGTPVPLIVDLHGCGSNADEEARWSRFNTLAEEQGFLVAYPEQDPAANGARCWNWYLPDHQFRDSGEPSIIAGITRAVMDEWSVDPRRVYVAGISGGGAMSVIMAVTYPDLYAAAMFYAGCPYQACLRLPEYAGDAAYATMGAHARVVPVIVIQGDLDPLVLYPNADFIVQQFLWTDDLADDGVNDGSVSREPSGTRTGAKPGGHTWEIDEYTDAQGCVLAQRWLIHGMGHAWSNAESSGSLRDFLLTDSFGPDLTSPTVDFLLSHPMPETGTGCVQEAPGGGGIPSE